MSEDTRVAALRGAVRDVPDFPKPGIVFKDITTARGDPQRLARWAEIAMEAAQG